MSEPTSTHSIEPARLASRRSRRLLISLQTTALIILALLLNSGTFGWTSPRLEAARHASRLIYCLSEHRNTELDSNISCYKLFQDGRPPVCDPDIHYCLSNLFLITTPFHDNPRTAVVELPRIDNPHELRLKAQELSTEWVNRYYHCRHYIVGDDGVQAIKFMLWYRIDSKDGIDKWIDKWRGYRMSNTYTFSLDLIGLRIDVNYVGLVLGSALILLYLWLYISLKQEIENISPLSSDARDDLAKYQLFLRSPAIHGATAIAPLLIFVLWVLHDLYTYPIGLFISERKTIFLLVIEGAAIIVMARLANACRKQLLTIEDLFSEEKRQNRV